MQRIKLFNEVLYFLLELCMLASLGYWGFQNSQHPYGKYLLAIGLPLLAAVLWGIFAAPRSTHQLGFPYRTLFALTLFGIAAFLLYQTGHTRTAIVFGILAIISELTALTFSQ